MTILGINLVDFWSVDVFFHPKTVNAGFLLRKKISCNLVYMVFIRGSNWKSMDYQQPSCPEPTIISACDKSQRVPQSVVVFLVKRWVKDWCPIKFVVAALGFVVLLVSTKTQRLQSSKVFEENESRKTSPKLCEHLIPFQVTCASCIFVTKCSRCWNPTPQKDHFCGTQNPKHSLESTLVQAVISLSRFWVPKNL